MEARRPRRLRDELRQTRAFRSEAQEATIAILRTAEVVRRHLTAVIEPHGITLQQFNVLRILRGTHPAPLPTLEIANRLIERTPGVTRLLDRLEEKGLVRRDRWREDRRLVHCSITPAGLALLEALDESADRADEAPMRELDAGEVSTLVRLLERVRAQVDR